LTYACEVSQSAALIAERFAVWGEVPHVVREVFGDPDPAGMAEALERFCDRELGAGVERAEFFEASVGSVHGLRLLDGRCVVVKVHGPGVSGVSLGGAGGAKPVDRRRLCRARAAPGADFLRSRHRRS
jgi:hypothetical protein